MNKKTLYESIMKDVSKVVKKHLNENNGESFIFDELVNWSNNNDVDDYEYLCDWVTCWQDIKYMVKYWAEEYNTTILNVIHILLRPECENTLEWICDLCSLGVYENEIPTIGGRPTVKYVREILQEFKDLY